MVETLAVILIDPSGVVNGRFHPAYGVDTSAFAAEVQFVIADGRGRRVNQCGSSGLEVRLA